ncbi:dTDP-4-dehydrorhamnose reductase [Burkholderia ubonensis]|uniref:dTDP-4-dehydrorhamnose reductase n=1 Tax=Burkholderia ubonensis TaxID=101571 RepID=UPI000752DD4F|nr:dTDP-4-dehydrorhamnose reductase [Burkholderia ubonensis]KWK82677.1 dTDP-4-dehydrorhamnose reductase [Burkholderia ubonensis]KWK93501.1 dTDP-4-dehydrorhamnose reductase [Burkholderia ubonensis]
MSEQFAEQRILVTGVGGQVGFELVRALQGLGEVVGLDRTACDLSDLDAVRSVVRKVSPTLIVNPAAYTAVDKAEEERELAMRVNGEAPGVLADEARKSGAALIHFSTDYVFDGNADRPYHEDDATGPLNVYGQSKLAGEQAIAASGSNHLILRTSWVYGMRGKNFLQTMLRLGRERPELKVVADQIGAPTWSKTIATVCSHIVAQACAAGNEQAWWDARSGVYHLTSADSTSWHGFAAAIFESMPSRSAPRVLPISTSEYRTPARRPANSRLSIDKLKRVFGLTPPDWRTALAMCLAEAGES